MKSAVVVFPASNCDRDAQVALRNLTGKEPVMVWHADSSVPDDVDLSDREVAMAEQLVASLTTEFEPEKYHDEYRERVLELIEAKAEGQVIAAPPVTEPAAPVVDLVAALEASLAAAKSKSSTKASGEAQRESA